MVAAMPGGATNRAGIRYEDLWMAWRTAEMLQGKVSRMRFEPLGSAGTGIEMTVVVDGTAWGEQVKSSARNWTIKRLKSEGVLAAAETQIVDLERSGSMTRSESELLSTSSPSRPGSGVHALRNSFAPVSACPRNGITVCVG